MRLMRFFVLSLLAMGLTACGGEGSGLPSQPSNPVKIISLQLTPSKSVIPVGWTQQYVVEAIFSDGKAEDVTNDPRIRLSSSDDKISTISDNGIAIGITPGEVVITAVGSDDGMTIESKASLVVTSASVVSLQITPSQAAIPVGISQQYEAIAELSDGQLIPVTNNKNIIWSTSDENIAAINNTNSKGLATGNRVGMVEVIATGNVSGYVFKGTAKLFVIDSVIDSLTITPSTATIPVGLTQAYDAIAHFSNGYSYVITNEPSSSWSIDDESIAKIDNANDKGVVTGVAAGTSTVRVSWRTIYQNSNADAEINVIPLPTNFGLEVSPEQQVVEGGRAQFRATLVNPDGSVLADVTRQSTLLWESDDSSIATISNTPYRQKGVAVGVSEGRVDINASLTVEQQRIQANSSLVVTKSPVQLRIQRQNLCLALPENQQYASDSAQFSLEVNVGDDNWSDISADPDVTWSIETENEGEQKFFNIKVYNIGGSKQPGIVNASLSNRAITGDPNRPFNTRSNHWLVARYNYNGVTYIQKTLVGAYIEGDLTPLSGQLEGYAPSCPVDDELYPG